MTDKGIKETIIKELEKAENVWKDVRREMMLKSETELFAMMESYTPSDIPGFPLVKNGKGKVGQFIAMILDIRDSTNHLLQAISNTKGVSQMERVLYETTAINTMGLIIINENSGNITEFLGDGFLALFSAETNSEVHKPKKAAEKCLRITKEIINPILKERYNLPELSIGIGLAYSKAIVTVVGFGDNLFPKAIGECVYRASKLSNGTNEILYDKALKLFWPSSKGGKISFSEKKHKNSDLTKGFTINKKYE